MGERTTRHQDRKAVHAVKVDKAPCWHCRRMFEPWTNERYYSDVCHDAAQRTGRAMADLIGLFELAASMGDDLTEEQARVIVDAERAAHGTSKESNHGEA